MGESRAASGDPIPGGDGRSQPASVKQVVVGPRPCCSPKQLRDLVQAKLVSLLVEGSGPGFVGSTELEVGLPYHHPHDALGRNWNIAEVRGLRAGQVAQVRLVIDSFREAFDLEMGSGAASRP